MNCPTGLHVLVPQRWCFPVPVQSLLKLPVLVCCQVCFFWRSGKHGPVDVGVQECCACVHCYRDVLAVMVMNSVCMSCWPTPPSETESKASMRTFELSFVLGRVFKSFKTNLDFTMPSFSLSFLVIEPLAILQWDVFSLLSRHQSLSALSTNSVVRVPSRWSHRALLGFLFTEMWLHPRRFPGRALFTENARFLIQKSAHCFQQIHIRICKCVSSVSSIIGVSGVYSMRTVVFSVSLRVASLSSKVTVLFTPFFHEGGFAISISALLHFCA